MSSVTSSAAGTLTVVNFGVAVSLSPSSGAPGGGFALTVTNTGTVADTFDLTLAGPAALVASLESTEVARAPALAGRADHDARGGLRPARRLNLITIATSRGNPGVLDSASASIAIATTSGLAIHFDPEVKVLSVPGTTSFLLIVNNMGNVEDAYTATIMGTDGPVTAFLVNHGSLPLRSGRSIAVVFLVPGVVSVDEKER